MWFFGLTQAETDPQAAMEQGQDEMTASTVSRRLRVVELALVLFVAFAQSLIISTYVLITGSGTRPSDSNSALVMMLSGVVFELTALAVLLYVLFRQGRNLSHLGFSFSWRDIPASIALTILAYITFTVCWIAIFYGYYFITGRVLDLAPKNVYFFNGGFTVWALTYVLLNPFYEELIVRAYLISEVKFLTGLNSVAVILSVLIQSSYHLYQGISSAFMLCVMFLIFSLYYLKTKRITPVILAHMYFDLFALLAYAHNKS